MTCTILSLTLLCARSKEIFHRLFFFIADDTRFENYIKVIDIKLGLKFEIHDSGYFWM